MQYATLLGAHALFCLALRRPRWAAFFAVFALFNVAAVLHATRAFASAAPGSPGLAPTTRILLSNVLSSNPDPARLLALIAAERPDLVALIEVNARWRRELEPALAAAYPWRFFQTREDNFGLAVFSRHPLENGRVEYFADAETPSLDFVLPRPEGAMRVLLTHALPPGDAASTRLRDRHLEELAKWCGAAAGVGSSSAAPMPVLVLGDFNATPWCPPLRRLLRAGSLRLAAGDFGRVAPTWPSPVLFLRIPLDHALLGPDVECESYRVGPDLGSDHFPVLLEIRARPDRAKLSQTAP